MFWRKKNIENTVVRKCRQCGTPHFSASHAIKLTWEPTPHSPGAQPRDDYFCNPRCIREYFDKRFLTNFTIEELADEIRWRSAP